MPVFTRQMPDGQTVRIHTHGNQYVQRRGNKWVVLDKTGRVLSSHATREKAEASFRAMEANKHGQAQ